MNYFGAYRFIFESPKWPIHLLIGAVCQFIPIVGQLVLMGYIYSVIEAKHRHGRDQFPDFTFDHLGAYLLRGVWPFLVSILAALPLILVAIPGVFVFAIAAAAGNQSGEPPWLAIFMIAGGILIFAVLGFALHVLVLPMALRAGLSQDFGTALSTSFVRDFLGRVWKEAILSLLFLIVTAPFLMLAGFLLLFIGVYAAAVLLVFAQIHFQYQLYELYLTRGGTPIPLKEA